MTITRTGNASRDVFAFIQQNSGRYSQAEASMLLKDHGFVYKSVQALLTSMKRGGMIAPNLDGKLLTLQTAYSPVKKVYPTYRATGPRKRKAAPAEVVVQSHSGNTGIAALAPVDAAPKAATASDVLNTMGVREAHALYLELHSFFGGVK